MMRVSNAHQWTVVIFFVAVSFILFFFTRGKPLGPGSETSISMALIPADGENLDCASNEGFGKVRCAYDRSGKSQKADPALHPYVASSGMLILVSGVFENPQVEAWRRRAIAEKKNEERTVIECEGIVLGKMKAAAVRWSKGAPFQSTPPTWAVNALSCRTVP